MLDCYVCKSISSPEHLSIQKLFLTDIRFRRLFTNILRLVPNLDHSRLERHNLMLNSHELKDLVMKYVPQLKIFQFSMDFSLDIEFEKEKIHQFMSRFYTSFWTTCHQWFVRFHCGIRWGNIHLLVYTLTYQMDFIQTSKYTVSFETVSTCPDQMIFPYDSIENICYESKFFHDDIWSQVQLKNFASLSIEFSLDQRFFSLVPNFNNLCMLDGTIHTQDYLVQLRNILDNAPRLCALGFINWPNSIVSTHTLTSRTIHKLYLSDHSYDQDKCLKLIQSSLGAQCRCLSIQLKDPQCILMLVSAMKNLRTLEIHCKFDQSCSEYDLVKCLQSIFQSKWNVSRQCQGHIFLRL